MIELKAKMGEFKVNLVHGRDHKWVIRVDGKYDYHLSTLLETETDWLMLDLSAGIRAKGLQRVLREAKAIAITLWEFKMAEIEAKAKAFIFWKSYLGTEIE